MITAVMRQLLGEWRGIRSHDECAFCIDRGLSRAGTPVHDKRNQRVCRGYQRFPLKLNPLLTASLNS